MADALLEQLTGEPAAPAQPAPSLDEQQMGGLLGQGATFALGLGRTASLGLSDLFLAEGANLAGGESARKDMLHGLNVAKQVNPYTNMAGEAAGLFVGGGKAITAAGEAAEGAIAARLGEGLGGSVASMAGRGAVEGGIMGASASMSEDVLGDHDVNAEKLFAHAAKDALLGGAIGAPLGALGYGAKRAFSGLLGSSEEAAVGSGEALARSKGPTSARVLDEVAGVEGAGQALKGEAKALQASIAEVRTAGATSEQATRLVDEVGDIAKARVAGGQGVASRVDDAAERFIQQRAAGNPEMADALRKVYVDRAAGLRTYEAGIEGSALKMADSGTRVMRNLEDIANEVQFTYKPQQMARLVDASKLAEQADHVAAVLQDVDQTLGMLEGTFTKGGAEVGTAKIRAAYKDALQKVMALGDDATLAARESASRDLFLVEDQLKREIGRRAGFGRTTFKGALGEGQQEFQDLYHRIQAGLEDANIWGGAGHAQARWNGSFSSMKPRRDEFGRRFAVAIDQEAGIIRPELDPSKLKSFLRSLDSEADSKVARETIEQVISGQRDRAAAIREFGDLSERQAAKLAEGLKDVDAFEEAYIAAQKEARVANKIRSMQLEERDKALGGIIGLGADVLQRPLTTMERLAQVKMTTAKVSKGVEDGLNRFFSGDKGTALVEKLTPKAAEAPAVANATKEAVTKDIEVVREMAAKPEAISVRIKRMVGDLSQHAPKTAAGVNMVAMRAMTYLAAEAPTPSVGVTLGSSIGKPRYSDQQVAEWQTKRDAVMNPAGVVDQLRAGRLNREGIRTVEAVYPKLFAEMQSMARQHIEDLAAKGLLDKMPMERQAAIATLLKVPPNGTWQPDFMLLMQGAKAMPAQQQGPAAGPAQVAKRPIKMNTALYETEAQQIEGRTK